MFKTSILKSHQRIHTKRSNFQRNSTLYTCPSSKIFWILASYRVKSSVGWLRYFPPKFFGFWNKLVSTASGIAPNTSQLLIALLTCFQVSPIGDPSLEYRSLQLHFTEYIHPCIQRPSSAWAKKSTSGTKRQHHLDKRSFHCIPLSPWMGYVYFVWAMQS